MAQLATLGVERTSRPSGRSRGRRRSRVVLGSRRCSTRSPHTIASKDAGLERQLHGLDVADEDVGAERPRGLGRAGIELDADDPRPRRGEGRREVPGRAADVEHVARAVGEGEVEQPA